MKGLRTAASYRSWKVPRPSLEVPGPPVGGAVVPAAPSLVGTAGVGQANLSWTVPANGGSTITSYNIYRNGVFLASVANNPIPMIPADVVAATPTWQFISQGSYENYNASAANYQTWKGWGIGGHVFRLGAAGDNMTQIGQGTTTANVLDDPHKWQHAMEGYAYNGINTTNPTSNVQQNMGIKIAHDTDPSIELLMWIQLMLPGDPWDDAAWSAWATFMAGRAACLKFFGGTGFFTDTERPGKGNGTTQF